MFLYQINRLVYYLFFYAVSMGLHNDLLKKCEDVTTKIGDGTAYWKNKKNSYTRSEYPCLKCNDQILICTCDTSTGHWILDKINCKEIKLNNMHCPNDLFGIRLPHNGILCLKIPRTIETYNKNVCCRSNNIILMDFTKPDICKAWQFLIKKNISEYWLLIRSENAFMPFVQRLPGKSWKKHFINDNFIISANESEEHCLKHECIKENEYQKFLFTENCITPLNIAYVFKSDLLATFRRPRGFDVKIYLPNKCYGIDWKKTVNIHIHTNCNLFKRVLSKYVLQEKTNKFIIIYYLYNNFGNKCMILSNSYNMLRGVNESLQWLPALSKNMLRSASSTEIKFVLKLKKCEKQLTLVIYNRKYFYINNEDNIGVQCFILTAYGLLKNAKVTITWENEDKSHSIFQFSLVSNSSSEYLCEGYSIYDFQLVTTRKLLVFKNLGHDFIIRWKISCIHKNKFDNLCNISRMCPIHIVNKIWRFFKNKNIYMTIFATLKVHQIKILNIKWKPNKNFVYCIHISASLKTKKDYNISNEIRNVDQYINNVYFEISKIRTMLQSLSTYLIKNLVIRKAEYCFPERAFLKDALQKNCMPHIQQSQGDFLRRAYWNKLTEPIFYPPNKNSTSILIDIYTSKVIILEPEEVLKKVIDVIDKKKNSLIAEDIHLISNIIKIHFKRLTSFNSYIRKTKKGTVTWKNAICAIIKLYNSIIDIKTDVLRMSAKLNSTNKLLESFEQSIDTLSTLSLSKKKRSGKIETGFFFYNDIIDYEDIGVSVKISKNLLFFLINPTIANVSGIALFSKNISGELNQKDKGSFIYENYRFLQSNHDISDFLYEPHLQLGVYLSKDLLNSLKSVLDLSNDIYKDAPLIVIKVYSNDKLFQQTTKNMTISSRIISISLPGYSKTLHMPIPLIIRKNKGHKLSSSDSCRYWNYGIWENDGITTMKKSGAKKDMVLCSLKHLSHFAYLVEYKPYSGGDDKKKIYNDIDNDITIAGCVIIFTGLCCIFLTVSKFSLLC